jgi:hypothetical protein
MNHLQEHELLDAYYGELAGSGQKHLTECPECRAGLAQLRDLLDGIREFPVPERGEGYGREVWARLQPRLDRPARINWPSWRLLAPAFALLLLVAFFGGMLTQRQRQAGISPQDRERIFLLAMSDHLERSQIALTQLLNGTPATTDLNLERARARDLLDENRLLRETASRDGDHVHAALLDDLERVLLDVANSGPKHAPRDLDALRRRVDNEGLLFKIRIASANTREKEQKL